MAARFLWSCLLALLLTSLLSAPATAQQPQLPSQQHRAVQAHSSLPLERLPAVDNAAMRAKAKAETDSVGPYQYAKALETGFTPKQHGTWERLSSTEWLWRLRIQSQNALSLNLAFTQFELPPGARLYVHDPEQKTIHGPYLREDATKGELWTPIVPGSEAVVELTVPAERRADVALRISKVSHGFRSLAPSTAGPKARACNIDVACPEADPWRNQVRSVGAYSVNGTDLCSGSLVNNTSDDGTPYFLTAEHCLEGDEDIAASMVFYWNYQNPTCRPPGSQESGTVTSDDRTDQTSTGALLRMSYGNVESQGRITGKPDVTLVEIDDTIPASYDLYLNGWDRTDLAPAEAVSIHHPQLHGKRITFEYDQTSIEGLRDPSNDTHIHVNWDAGTTEKGSSGSPLFAPSQKVVGVLSAGGSGCEIQDWYGRIHKAWEGGGTPSTRLKDWLAPNEPSTQTLQGRPLADDSIPPARPQNFRVASVTQDSVTLRWSATGDDGSEGTASRYALRYRVNSPIASESDFEEARDVSRVPTPQAAGTSQSVTLSVGRDTSYYFAIRAFDDALNRSPIAATDRDVTLVGALRVTTPPSPNPTQQIARMQFVVEREQAVRVALYDALGRRVRVLLDGTVRPFRRQTVTTDLSPLSSGMYFLHVRGQSAARTEQVSLVK